MFSLETLVDYFSHGDVRGAMDYMEAYPEAREFLAPYKDLFEEEHYLSYAIPERLNEALLLYQKYFRKAFYLHEEESVCSSWLMKELGAFLGSSSMEGEELEGILGMLFEKEGFHFLGGKTCGNYGPYIWKETRPTTYQVELPDGISSYRVNILGGFVLRSWMDYITFHQAGTGGWTEKDGTINCVESAYDFESERFLVCFLKHEAQHAEDMKRWPEITPEELEYRAKLVEMTYSKDEGLLERLLSVADSERVNDSHAQAALRLKGEMEEYLGRSLEERQKKARELFHSDSVRMSEKYGKES